MQPPIIGPGLSGPIHGEAHPVIPDIVQSRFKSVDAGWVHPPPFGPTNSTFEITGAYKWLKSKNDRFYNMDAQHELLHNTALITLYQKIPLHINKLQLKSGSNLPGNLPGAAAPVGMDHPKMWPTAKRTFSP